MTPQEEENITLSVAQLIKMSEQAQQCVAGLSNAVEDLQAAVRGQEAKIAKLEELLQRQGIATEDISNSIITIKGNTTPVIDEGGPRRLSTHNAPRVGDTLQHTPTKGMGWGNTRRDSSDDLSTAAGVAVGIGMAGGFDGGDC